MKNYLLENYHLSSLEILQSLFVSEYGLRHCVKAKADSKHKWGHRLIAGIEFFPFVGPVASAIELLYARFCTKRPSSSSKTLLGPNKITNPSPEVPKNIQPDPVITPRPSIPLPEVLPRLLFKGSQQGCYGKVPVAEVEQIRQAIGAQSPEGISFNIAHVTSYLTGGACSSMSLDFVDRYLTIRNAHGEGSLDSKEFLDQVSGLGAFFTAASKTMRVRQAAFNTIEVNKDAQVDLTKNKVQALANFHQLVLKEASASIKNITPAKLEKKFSYLGEGVYIVRMIMPLDNERLEQWGHTVIFIKERGISLFYDPNHGLNKLPPDRYQPILAETLNHIDIEWEVPETRFYKVEKKA